MNSTEKNIQSTDTFSISHEEFMLVINEEQNYFRLKETVRTKDSQRSDMERDRLI